MTTQEKHDVAVKPGTKALAKEPKRHRIDEAQEAAALDKELVHEDMQHGTDLSISKQEQLKRAVQQHPQRDLPRVESIEAPETPPRI
jgi:hypothetical protein